jgi:hypothetical protein
MDSSLSHGAARDVRPKARRIADFNRVFLRCARTAQTALSADRRVPWAVEQALHQLADPHSCRPAPDKAPVICVLNFEWNKKIDRDFRSSCFFG